MRNRAIEEELGRRSDALPADYTVRDVAEIMRGQWRHFAAMDSRDNYGGVPAWHARLRQARNGDRSFFRILNAATTATGGAA